ncbi:unnamed protein product [Sphagnum tenellum]
MGATSTSAESSSSSETLTAATLPLLELLPLVLWLAAGGQGGELLFGKVALGRLDRHADGGQCAPVPLCSANELPQLLRLEAVRDRLDDVGVEDAPVSVVLASLVEEMDRRRHGLPLLWGRGGGRGEARDDDVEGSRELLDVDRLGVTRVDQLGVPVDDRGNPECEGVRVLVVGLPEVGVVDAEVPGGAHLEVELDEVATEGDVAGGASGELVLVDGLEALQEVLSRSAPQVHARVRRGDLVGPVLGASVAVDPGDEVLRRERVRRVGPVEDGLLEDDAVEGHGDGFGWEWLAGAGESG